jgi:hypothetical protein
MVDHEKERISGPNLSLQVYKVCVPHESMEIGRNAGNPISMNNGQKRMRKGRIESLCDEDSSENHY